MNNDLLKQFISKNNFILFSELLHKTIDFNYAFKEEYSYLYEYIFSFCSQPEKYIIECLKYKIPIEDVSSFLLFCNVNKLLICIKTGLENSCIDMSNSIHYEYFQSFILDCIYDKTLNKKDISMYLSCITSYQMISNDIKSICNTMHINGRASMFVIELEKKIIELENLDLFTPSYYMSTIAEGCFLLKTHMYKMIEEKLKEY